MKLENEIQNLAKEAFELPEKMNIDRIRKVTKRRKMIHNVAVVGRTLLVLFATLFLSLFIGVNTSTSFARACADMPIIGDLSQSMVVRSEIRSAIRHNKNVQEYIQAGGLHEYHQVQGGSNSQIRCTVDSYLADSLAFSFLLKVDTSIDLLPEDQFSLSNLRLIDLDTNEEEAIDLDSKEEKVIYCPATSGTDIKAPGKLQLVQTYWEKPHRNFAVAFEIDDTFGKSRRIKESFRFEFKNVDISPVKHYPVDQTIEFEDKQIHISDLLVSETTTLVAIEQPNWDGYIFKGIDLFITDENGNTISDPGLNNGILNEGYQVQDENGKTYTYIIMPTIFYKNVQKVKLQITAICYTCYDNRILTVYPHKNIATIGDETIPIEVYGSDHSYGDFGLSDYTRKDAPKEGTMLFVIPYDAQLPLYNYVCSQTQNGLELLKEEHFGYPTTKIGGKEYLIIKVSREYEETLGQDPIYRFVSNGDSETSRLIAAVEVDLTEASDTI